MKNELQLEFSKRTVFGRHMIIQHDRENNTLNLTTWLKQFNWMDAVP